MAHRIQEGTTNASEQDTPLYHFATKTIGGGEPEIVEALPDDAIESGMTYLPSDFSRVSVVDDCSTGPEDSFTLANFPYSDGTMYNHVFANTNVAVMHGNQGGADGVTITINGELPDVEVSQNGEWSFSE